MRMLSIVLLILSSMAFSDTSDMKTIRVGNDMPNNIVELLTEKTRIEQRTVVVNSTCSRTEYQYRCHNQPPICRNECRNGYCRRVCYPGRRVCSNIPVRVNYPCQRTETRQVEVFDHYVNTSVKLNLDFGDNNINEQITFIARGNQLIAKSNTKNYAVYITDKDIRSSSTGQTVYKDVELSIKYIDAQKINNVIGNGIKNVHLRNNILSFELDRDFNFKDFSQHIKLFEDQRIGGDVFLREKDLMKADMMDIQVNGNKKVMSLDLRSIINRTPQRLRVVLSTEYKPLNYTLLNYETLETKTSASWLFY